MANSLLVLVWSSVQVVVAPTLVPFLPVRSLVRSLFSQARWIVLWSFSGGPMASARPTSRTRGVLCVLCLAEIRCVVCLVVFGGFVLLVLM